MELIGYTPIDCGRDLTVERLVITYKPLSGSNMVICWLKQLSLFELQPIQNI